MSGSIITTEDSLHEIHPFEVSSIESAVFGNQPEASDIIKQLHKQQRPIPFQGRLEVQGVPSIPEQAFTVFLTDRGFNIESQLTDSWPVINIECEFDPSLTKFRVINFVLRLANETVDGYLLHTRVILSLDKAGTFSIQAVDFGKILEVSHKLLSESQEKELRRLAKLIRKLKYIQSVFNIQFSLPEKFSSQEMELADIVFRGITEGQFTTRGSKFTFKNIPASEIDLTKPPFNGVGAFFHEVEGSSILLYRQLPIGPVSIHLDKAELASPRVVDHIKGLTSPIDVSFEVLDNKITYRFEKFARKPRSQRMQQLIRFKYQLTQEEPKELVDLVDESLQNDVSSDEALQIAVGWTQYNDLPDRYCPQEPKLNAAGQWHVPIYLVHTKGEGGPVGELIIDVKTGVIVSHTSIEEIRSKGLALAEQILHA
ncbi:MAG: hypothetical protein WBV94_20925 [Blastocatellia bacterium]